MRDRRGARRGSMQNRLCGVPLVNGHAIKEDTAPPEAPKLADLVAAIRAATVAGQVVPLLLTMEQAAELLGVAHRTIKRMVTERTLPGIVRLGRSVRISRPELEDWIRRGCPKINGKKRP